MTKKTKRNSYTPKQVKDAVLRGQLVEAPNSWMIHVSDDDMVELWPPGEHDGYSTHLGNLDAAVTDFCRKAEMPIPGVNETQGDQVKLPGDAATILGPDSTTKEFPSMKPTVNQTPGGLDQKGTTAPDTSLGKDTSGKVPKNFDPAVNKRPRNAPQRGGLPDTSLGEDTSGAPTRWKDKKVKIQEDGRTGRRRAQTPMEMYDAQKDQLPGSGAGQQLTGFADRLRQQLTNYPSVDINVEDMPDGTVRAFDMNYDVTVDPFIAISELQKVASGSDSDQIWGALLDATVGGEEMSMTGEKESLHDVKKPKRGPGQLGEGKAQMGAESGEGVVGRRRANLQTEAAIDWLVENPDAWNEALRIVGEAGEFSSLGLSEDLKIAFEGHIRHIGADAVDWGEVAQVVTSGSDHVVGRRADSDPFKVTPNEDSAAILNKGENPSDPEEVITQSKGEKKDEKTETEGKSSRIQDSFADTTPDASRIYADMKRARPSEDLLADIMDPDKWAAGNVFAKNSQLFDSYGEDDSKFGPDDEENLLDEIKDLMGVAEQAGDEEAWEMLSDAQIYLNDGDMSSANMRIQDAEAILGKAARTAAPRIKENWGNDGGYSREIGAESSEELHALTVALGGDEVDWSKFVPAQPDGAPVEEEGVVDGQTAQAPAAPVEASKRPFVGRCRRRAQSSDLYQLLMDAGVPVENHESDLYFPVTPETQEIVDNYGGKNITTFTDDIDGELWFDAPFSFTPFWEEKGVQTKGSGRRQAAFMDPQVWEGDFLKLDGDQGIIFVPAEEASTPEGLLVADGMGNPVDAEDFYTEEYGDFYGPGRIQEAETVHGWGAQMSASGYMDQTDLTVFDTEEEAIDYLMEFYMVDDSSGLLEEYEEYREQFEEWDKRQGWDHRQGPDTSREAQVADEEAGCDREEKEAVDPKAEEYYSGYLGDYGKELTKGDVTEPKGAPKKDKKDKKKPKDDEGKKSRRAAWLKRRQEAQAVPQQAAPAPAPGTPTVPGGAPGTPTPGVSPQAPAPGGAPAPQGPAVKPKPPTPDKLPGGAGDAGLEALGWTSEEVSLMDDEDKKKILEIKLNKPGTKKSPKLPGDDAKQPGAPAPGAQQPPAPSPTPPAPGGQAPAAPAQQPVAPPVAARLAKMIMRKINRRRVLKAQAAPAPQQPAPQQPAPQQPAPAPAAPAPALGTGAPDAQGAPPAQQGAVPEFEGEGGGGSDDKQALDILNEVQGMDVEAAVPEQVSSQKASVLAQRLLAELGMTVSDAKKLYGIGSQKGLRSLFE